MARPKSTAPENLTLTIRTDYLVKPGTPDTPAVPSQGPLFPGTPEIPGIPDQYASAIYLLSLNVIYDDQGDTTAADFGPYNITEFVIDSTKTDLIESINYDDLKQPKDASTVIDVRKNGDLLAFHINVKHVNIYDGTKTLPENLEAYGYCY